MTSYLCGVDIGGTFTDCVVVDGEGRVTTAKVPSTPHDFGQGMIAALGAAAAGLGIDLDALCQNLTLLSHGTTVGTNTIIQKSGAKVGLITTKGHNDVIHIMRGSRGYTGRDLRKVVHFSEGQKPDPLVPKRLIRGVSERVDCFGNVVVPLNVKEAEEAARALLEAGVDAIAVCFLWSFKRPDHERQVADIVRGISPDTFVTCSADLVPKWGEYERTTATALNAYIGPPVSRYLRHIDGQVRELGYPHPLHITQCAGGTISVDRAVAAPLLTLDSGPVSGVTGSVYLGRHVGHPNVITTDMGGTSFDVGVIYEGQPAFSYSSNVSQYEYFLPKVDIQAIGSGGGSLVTIDDVTGSLRVGPDSAGAVPGPASYGRGGTQPTVTDADLLIGYLNPDNFAGGQMTLDRAAAEAAIAPIAERLGMSALECASGIAQIAEHQMADLIRKVTIEKGFDPRDFTLFAFGGAGPVHAAVFARELGIKTVVIPQRETASTWCAFGAAVADILHLHEQVDMMTEPLERERIAANFEALAAQARDQLEADGIAADRQHLALSLDMRHKGQINEVEVEIAADDLGGLDTADLRRRFEERYELLYGKDSSFAGAKVEIVTYRVRATAETPKPKLAAGGNGKEPSLDDARLPAREVYFPEAGGLTETQVFDGHHLPQGSRIEGPAIVETNATTVVVHAEQTLEVDAFGNFVIDLSNGSSAS